MATKILLLSAFFFFFLNTATAAGTSRVKQNKRIEVSDNGIINNHVIGNDGNSWITESSIHINHTHTPNSDDDGRTHHFSFEAFTRNRIRRVAAFMLKVILLITHISSLLFGFAHLVE